MVVASVPLKCPTVVSGQSEKIFFQKFQENWQKYQKLLAPSIYREFVFTLKLKWLVAVGQCAHYVENQLNLVAK